MIRQKTIKYRKTVIFRYYSAENCKRTIKGGGPRRRGAETAVTGEADGERGGYPLNGAPIFGGRCAESGGQADFEEKSAKMTEAIALMLNQRAVRSRRDAAVWGRRRGRKAANRDLRLPFAL